MEEENQGDSWGKTNDLLQIDSIYVLMYSGKPEPPATAYVSGFWVTPQPLAD